jgi:hypothetical protein
MKDKKLPSDVRYTVITKQRRGYIAHYHYRQQRSHTTVFAIRFTEHGLHFRTDGFRWLIWSLRNYWRDHIDNIRRLPGESQAQYNKRMNEAQEMRAALMMFRMARPQLTVLAWVFVCVIVAIILLVLFR